MTKPLRRKRLIPDTNAKKNRTSTETFAEILKLCKQPTAQTRIMYKTNMSYPQTLKFLTHLQKLQLLKADHNGKKYETTEKGFEYLKKHSDLQKLLKP
jgi:predicted transcriptional regulator